MFLACFCGFWWRLFVGFPHPRHRRQPPVLVLCAFESNSLRSWVQAAQILSSALARGKLRSSLGVPPPQAPGPRHGRHGRGAISEQPFFVIQGSSGEIVRLGPDAFAWLQFRSTRGHAQYVDVLMSLDKAKGLPAPGRLECRWKHHPPTPDAGGVMPRAWQLKKLSLS